MLYACVLMYVALIYIRPAEIVSAWATIPFVDILSGIAAVIGVMSIAARPRPFFNLPQDKLVLAFWAVMVAFSLKIWIWLSHRAFLTFIPVVFMYFLIRAGVQSKTHIKGLIYLLIALNVFLAINGIVQFHTGVGLGNVTMKLDRIYGTGIFNDPNDLGMTFVMSVPFIMAVISTKKEWLIFRVLAVVALSVVLLAIYHTNSRGALVGLAAALVCHAFLRYRSVSGTVVATLFLVILAAAAPSRGAEIQLGEASSQSRIHAWAAGWSMLKTYPLTGVGFGQYTEYYERVAHNSFVNTFAELGLIGAFCFVGMFYWYFKGVRLIPEANADFAHWRRALIVSAVGTLTCGWFLSRQYVPVFYILLALGSCAIHLRVLPEARPSLATTNRDILNIGGLTIFGVFVVYFSIRTMAIWSGGG